MGQTGLDSLGRPLPETAGDLGGWRIRGQARHVGCDGAATAPRRRETPSAHPSFQVVQWSWIVERTFGWLNRSRRLSKDFEALPETTEAWVRIAMIPLMVRRLAASA